MVLVMELLDTPLKLDLRGAKWVDLLELLEVKESLRDRQLVAAARGSQEALEFGAVRQLQEQPVDLSQRFGVHILEFLPLENGLHEERPDLADVALLELCLREDLRDRLLEVLLECGDELAAASGDQLLTLLEHERWNDVIMVQGRHLDLHPLDTIATDEANLGVPALLPLRLSEFESNQPLDLRL